MRRALTAAILLVLFLTMSREAAAGSLEKHSTKDPQAATASVRKDGPAFVTDPELMDGFRLLYEQNFPGARPKFRTGPRNILPKRLARFRWLRAIFSTSSTATAC